MKHLYTTKNHILLAILGLFGISACDTAVEYGCPQASFKVHGTVTDEQHEPIQGIAVRGRWKNDTTGADGKYQLNSWGMDVTDAPDSLYFTDADSLRGVGYRDTVVAVSWDGVEAVGGDGGWNEGTYILGRDIELHKR